MRTTQEQKQIISELNQNTGSQQYFKIPFSKIVYTEGIEDLIKRCGCWWLISDLGIELSNQEKPFLIVRIEVNEDDSAIITLKEDSDLEIIYKKEIGYTDFSLKEFEFYLIDKVFLLKNEY